MTAEPATPTLLETAARIEARKEAQERYTRRVTIAVITLMFLLNLLFYVVAVYRFGDILDQQNVQLERIEDVIEENRQTAKREAEASDRILMSIGDRIVPRSEVRKLEAQVVKLRREARMLRRAVRQLNRLLAARTAVGGG